jgi:hypothetical protein
VGLMTVEIMFIEILIGVGIGVILGKILKK